MTDPDDTLPASEDLDHKRIVRRAERQFMGSQQRRQPDATFAHYTDARGLDGIISKGIVWASDYRKLNDSVELTIGEDAVAAELRALIEVHADDTARGFICRLVEEFRSGNRLIDITDVYVTSFSREGDLLSQWLTRYGDFGKGFSIGFRSLPLPTEEEAAASLDSTLAVDFRPCIYDASEFRAQARQILVDIADNYEKYILTHCRHGDELLEKAIRKQAVTSAMAKLGALVPFLKHHSFQDEREWRLIHIGTPPTKLTRPSPRYGVVEYLEVPLRKPERMDLVEVIAAPLVDSLDYARATLDRYGYGDVPVRRSDSPYRG